MESVSTPTFSVVIPLYNKERHIARAIESVLSQTLGDFELIVVDDGSTDGSARVAKGFNDHRIRFLSREHVNSSGGHAARNLGIAEARADLVAFLDADDEWLPEHLETIKRLAEKHPECGAYATGYSMTMRDGRTVTPRQYGIPEPPWEGVIPNYFHSRMVDYIVHTSAIVVRKDVFTRVGAFPVGERRAGDDDMWYRIALLYDIAYSRHLGLVYHCEADDRISDDKTLPFKHRLFDTLAKAALSDSLKPGITRDEVAESRNKFILDRLLSFLLAGRIGASEAKFWLEETRSTRLFRGEWMLMNAITDVPGFVVAWRLERRLRVVLQRLGIRRRPRSLLRRIRTLTRGPASHRPPSDGTKKKNLL
jgi:glycosyltransferase involved in cell wall biosynthesis